TAPSSIPPHTAHSRTVMGTLSSHPRAPPGPTGSLSCLPRRSSQDSRLSALLARPWPAADPPPGEPRYELLGGVLGDHLSRAEPVGGAELGHADQAHAQQVRLIVADARILPDDLADDVRAVTGRAVKPLADGGLVAKGWLEDQAKRLGGAADEIEERGEGGGHALLVVGRGGQSVADGRGQRIDALVEQGEVQLELAGKVLVQDRLADPGLVRDLVHRRRVIPPGDENLPGAAQE